MYAYGHACVSLNFQNLKPKAKTIKVSLTVKTKARHFAGFDSK